MLSDSTILKHIARQPKRAAGYKQLVRELGLHGHARGELDAILDKLRQIRRTGPAQFRALRPPATCCQQA